MTCGPRGVVVVDLGKITRIDSIPGTDLRIATGIRSESDENHEADEYFHVAMLRQTTLRER